MLFLIDAARAEDPCVPAVYWDPCCEVVEVLPVAATGNTVKPEPTGTSSFDPGPSEADHPPVLDSSRTFRESDPKGPGADPYQNDDFEDGDYGVQKPEQPSRVSDWLKPRPLYDRHSIALPERVPGNFMNPEIVEALKKAKTGTETHATAKPDSEEMEREKDYVRRRFNPNLLHHPDILLKETIHYPPAMFFSEKNHTGTGPEIHKVGDEIAENGKNSPENTEFRGAAPSGRGEEELKMKPEDPVGPSDVSKIPPELLEDDVKDSDRREDHGSPRPSRNPPSHEQGLEPSGANSNSEMSTPPISEGGSGSNHGNSSSEAGTALEKVVPTSQWTTTVLVMVAALTTGGFFLMVFVVQDYRRRWLNSIMTQNGLMSGGGIGYYPGASGDSFSDVPTISGYRRDY